MARIRNRQEPVTNWLAAGFLATLPFDISHLNPLCR